ncbi:hypothetical protein [Streptomyces globisporus]|uniref:hypothetical protein n=1 Tax=Streptomyces globisporus TaxID=1908 RepID=UPI000AC8E16D|nr:hypothetical protein [Streptomyces globisporus]
MEEVVLLLKELLFPAIADVAVRSVNADVEKARIAGQRTTVGAACQVCGACSTGVTRSNAGSE